KGGKHLLLPPGYSGAVPDGYHIGRATSFRVIAGMRSLPVGGDVRGAIELLKTIKVRPLDTSKPWNEPTWLDHTPAPQDQTQYKWEDKLQYWEVLHEVVNSEPPLADSREYGELAALGINKGQPFNPDARMRHILEQAAKLGAAQMRAEAFADNRPDR